MSEMNQKLSPGPVVGLLAHVDAGKTTLTEAMLYACGGSRKKGSVEEGNTHTDTMEVERERAISVRAASVSLENTETRVTLVDTPGHVDFSSEVDRALRILDAGVLILPAVEGVEARTALLWELLERQKLPVILFINKIDRMGSDTGKVAETIGEEFSSGLLPLNRVLSEGDREASVEELPLTAESLVEAAAGEDEALLEEYLSRGRLSEEQILRGLRLGIGRRSFFPVIYGSGALGLGVDTLLKALFQLVPCGPIGREEDPPAGEVFRITHDKTLGRIAHIRLYEGKLRSREVVELYNPRENGNLGLLPPTQTGEEKEPLTEEVRPVTKITRICRMEGDRLRDMQEVLPGEVAALTGLSNARVGDIFGAFHEKFLPPEEEPLLSVGVRPMSPELLTALRELEAEDPALRLCYSQEERELSLSITGPMQLEILKAILKSRFGLEAEFTRPAVIYKETPAGVGIGHEAYTMPKPCWAILDLKVEPLPRGSGYRFSSVVPYKELFYKYQTHIATEVPRALMQGVYNWQVIDLAVTLIGGNHHTIHTHPLDFFLATPLALIKALENAGTVLLEPMRTWRLRVEESLGGKVLGDITRMRGSYDTPVYSHGNALIEARVPVASSLDYPLRLATLSGGKASLAQHFSGYEPTEPGEDKIARRRGCDPRDRAKWILVHRGAMRESDKG